MAAVICRKQKMVQLILQNSVDLDVNVNQTNQPFPHEPNEMQISGTASLHFECEGQGHH